MKTCIFLVICCCMLYPGLSQTKVPAFSILQSNGKIFRAKDLPTGKPVMIVYFSPECDHCDELINDLQKRKASFRQTFITLITFLPVGKVSRFVKENGFGQEPNIVVGTEGNSFFVRDYYGIVEMPFIAVYGRNGDLVKSYRKDPSLAEVFNIISNLK